MTLNSMTGFAAAQGEWESYNWSWDIRSVNGKGLDVRLRVPEWLDGLENIVKKRASDQLGRGNVNITLRVLRPDNKAQELQVNEHMLEVYLAAVSKVEAHAQKANVQLSPARATDFLTMRGALEYADTEQDYAPLLEHLLSEFDSLLNDFVNMRAEEGHALHAILSEQLKQIDDLTQAAIAMSSARSEQIQKTLRAGLARIVENVDALDEGRIAQELAMLAVKADVTEELDRLLAHCEAAHKLLRQGGLVGRRLDFLMQEFNREANTLCAKAQNADLTAIGLELKTVIDQLREQVQNIE